MDGTRRVPTGIDPSVPSVARMYDYYLGGKDNFAADREAAEKIIALGREIGGDAREIAKENRCFLRRTVRLLARSGISQFIDIGAGLPTQENVHEVAERHIDDPRVVYVDNDPIVLTHARALLADNRTTIAVSGDLREPKAIFDDPAVRAHIDFTRPFAVLLVAVLHFITDDEEAARIVDQVREHLAPGCHLVLTHAYQSGRHESAVDSGKQVYSGTSSGGVTTREVSHLESYFAGLDLLEPGIVPVQAWRPEVPWEVSADLTGIGILGAVGRVT
ncbi:SAM-dependent methyltransferase [Sphaerimonospora cavernae]|uniref:SAM-dependent methyltransferase n=1 Tax=Sphaerimonospora cavernae TaxID=1740611 RepID=A0ABV6U472_9ACTN